MKVNGHKPARRFMWGRFLLLMFMVAIGTWLLRKAYQPQHIYGVVIEKKARISRIEYPTYLKKPDRVAFWTICDTLELGDTVKIR